MSRIRFPATGYVVSIALLSIALFCVLSYYAMPAVDDFCYGAKARHLGYLDSVMWFYNNWIGRIPATALINLPSALVTSLGVSLITAYQAMALCLIGLIVWFGVWAAQQFLPFMKGAKWVGLVFAATLIANTRSIADLLYWLPASASYTVPALLSGVVFLALIKNASAGDIMSPLKKFLLILLAFLASGFNEFTFGFLVLFVLGSQYMRWRLHQNFDDLWFGIGMLIATILGVMIVALAPGNEVRMSVTGGGDVFGSLLWGPIHFLNYVGLRIDTYGVLGWLLLLSILTLVHDGYKPSSEQDGHSVEIWLPMVLWVLAAVFMFTAGHYGIVRLLPARVQNEIQFLGAIALSMSVQAAVRHYADEINIFVKRHNGWLSLRSGIVLSAVLLAISLGNIKGLLTLANGLSDFRAEYMAQFELFSTTQDRSVSVRPLKAQPTALIGSVLYPGFTNYDQCVESYFGLEEISVID